jgi:hypothetical protein
MLHFSSNKEDCVATDSPAFEAVSTIDTTTFVVGVFLHLLELEK